MSKKRRNFTAELKAKVVLELYISQFCNHSAPNQKTDTIFASQKIL